MRTFDAHPRRALEARYKLPPDSIERLVFGSAAWARCQRGELTNEEFWTVFGRQRGLSAEQTKEFRHQFFAGDRLDDELVTFIRSLRPQLKTALLSNFSAYLRDLLERYGLGDLFDAVVISGEVGFVKPDARIYHIACQQLGILPAEAVFVDDFVENVEAAQQVGLQAIHFSSTAQVIQSLQQLQRRE